MHQPPLLDGGKAVSILNWDKGLKMEPGCTLDTRRTDIFHYRQGLKAENNQKFPFL